MSKIEVQIENLQEAISGLKKVREELESIQGGVNTVHTEMDASWDGPACEEFLRRLHAQSDNLGDVKSMLDTYIDYGERSLKDLIEEDRRQKEIIRMLREMLENVGSVIGSNSGWVSSPIDWKPIPTSHVVYDDGNGNIAVTK